MKVWLKPGPYELPPEYGNLNDWREMTSDIAMALLDEDAISLFEDMARSVAQGDYLAHPLRPLIAKVED